MDITITKTSLGKCLDQLEKYKLYLGIAKEMFGWHTFINKTKQTLHLYQAQCNNVFSPLY